MAGGHLIDALDHEIYTTTVKSISVKLLQVIAHKVNLEILCGNIDNAYVNAYTNKKVYAIAGDEFRKAMEGSVVIIVRALYGLRTSSERWHAHLANTLRGFNFNLTRYDNNVWIRQYKDVDCYDYICIHVDDFMAVGKRLQRIMNEIKSVCKSKIGRTARLLSQQRLQVRQERTPMCRQQEVNQGSTHPDREHLRHPQEVRQPIRNRRQPRARRLPGTRL